MAPYYSQAPPETWGGGTPNNTPPWKPKGGGEALVLRAPPSETWGRGGHPSAPPPGLKPGGGGGTPDLRSPLGLNLGGKRGP